MSSKPFSTTAVEPPSISDRMVIGWREWVTLPQLGIKQIKAKIDTGARTSALHAFEVNTYEENGKSRVTFSIHPRARSTRKVLTCTTDLLGMRWVTDSGGHSEQRCVIQTALTLGTFCWPIELTLTSRDDMRFRMLLGRTALRQYFLIDTSASYLLGKKLVKPNV